MLLPWGVGFVVSGNLKNAEVPLGGVELTISGFPDFPLQRLTWRSGNS
jgi:hypothetical protein